VCSLLLKENFLIFFLLAVSRVGKCVINFAMGKFYSFSLWQANTVESIDVMLMVWSFDF
jgi:hypothetical protein